LVHSLVYSRDGAQILIAGQEFAWSILDATTGKIVQTARGASDAAVFSPDQGKVLTRYEMGATLWSASTGTVIAKLDGHNALVSAAWFSADGKRIVTGSWDETVRLWDAETGASLGLLRGHLGRVNDVVLSPDDRYAATASMDGTVKVFPVHLDPFLSRARAALGQN
jgi:WD40 repeat protein